MSGNKKDNNKERLQKQSEHRATGLADNRQKEGYTKGMAVDPSQHILQTDSTKVQNPNRNLAKGGNNTNAKFTSA